uniref:Uncharacterized protein n=1 Tax=viral metagenome TaxID=1070528 RepID=A0A6C0J8N3_9ZZZZ
MILFPSIYGKKSDVEIIMNLTDPKVLGLDMSSKRWKNILSMWQGMQKPEITHVFYHSAPEHTINELSMGFNSSEDVTEALEVILGMDDEVYVTKLLDGLIKMKGESLSEMELLDPEEHYITYHSLIHGAYFERDGTIHNVIGEEVSSNVTESIRVKLLELECMGVLTNGNDVIGADDLRRLAMDSYNISYEIKGYDGNKYILFVSARY